ncbi:MAG: hypothetical protein JNL75_09715 [Chitinophagales bacterium]|nr:hypothetical protein [Chitinophagales bacterium]
MEESKLVSFAHKIDVKTVFYISIVIHTFLELLFPSMYGDQFMQINSFFNWIDGHGLSLNYVTPDDISKVKYESLNLWPFGFVWGIYPLYLVTKSVVISVMFWNILAILLFFYAVKGILELLPEYFSHTKMKVVYFFLAICIMPSRYMGSTDLWCLSLLFLCLWQFLDIVLRTTEYKSAVHKTILISIAMSVIVTLRYSYWLYVVLFPGLFIIYGFLKNRRNFHFGLFSLLIIGILSGMYILSHYHYFGQIFPTSLPPKDTLQWSALLRYNPIFFNSLFRDSIVRNFVWKFIPGHTGALVFQISAHIFGLIIVYYLLKWLKTVMSNFKFSDFLSTNVGVFLLSTIAIIFFNNVTFIYSALKFGILNVMPDLFPFKYSAVAEVRYFAPSIILIFLLVCLSIQFNFIKVSIASAVVFAIIVNCILLNSRFISERFGVLKHLHYSESTEQFLSILQSKGDIVFLPNECSDLQDNYMSYISKVPILKSDSSKMNTSIARSILTYRFQADTVYGKYQPRIIAHGIKPNIDLIEFTIHPQKK